MKSQFPQRLFGVTYSAYADDESIMGIEYYQTVTANGIRTYPEFIPWRKNHSANRIITWYP